MANWFEDILTKVADEAKVEVGHLAAQAVRILLPNLAAQLQPVVLKAVQAALGDIPFLGGALAPFVDDAVAKIVAELVADIEAKLPA